MLTHAENQRMLTHVGYQRKLTHARYQVWVNSWWGLFMKIGAGMSKNQREKNNLPDSLELYRKSILGLQNPIKWFKLIIM